MIIYVVFKNTTERSMIKIDISLVSCSNDVEMYSFIPQFSLFSYSIALLYAFYNSICKFIFLSFLDVQIRGKKSTKKKEREREKAIDDKTSVTN